MTRNDKVLSIAPIFTGVGSPWFFTALLKNATSYWAESGSPDKYWDLVAEFDPTIISGLPTQFNQMSGVDDPGDAASIRMVYYGGEPLSPDSVSFLHQRDIMVSGAYGSFDGGACSYKVPTFDASAAVMYREGASMEVAVIDDDGEECPPGDAGRIIWRGGGVGIGYFDDWEYTAERWDVGGPNEGWYHSQDSGIIDEFGNLHVVGRLDDIIIRAGQNINPRTIEEYLGQHPDIEEVAVVGMPDPEFGERVCAYVTPIAGGEIYLEDISEFLDDQGLAKYKRPERLEIRDELPATDGEIDKDALNADITAKLESDGVL